MRPNGALAGLVGAMIAALPCSAADKRYPDWPCMQLKVPELSLVAVWSGPPIEQNAEMPAPSAPLRALTEQLAARRTPMDEAKSEITAFVTGTKEEKQDKATRLFSGLFENLNRQRSDVMNGLERFSRKQKLLAQKIRENTLKIRELQDNSNPDEATIQELGRQIEWDTRIFGDRQKSTTFLCEVPVTIEQRLFALGRIIEDLLN
jgi:hypothetical protein